MTNVSVDDLELGTPWASHWSIAPGVTYLNHGSFGPAPMQVIEARQRWFRELEAQPMDFYIRRMEPLLDEAADRLARFLGCERSQLAFCPNATTGMNIVAQNISLRPGDEVLLNDHEYGAVLRIWKHTCERTGAVPVIASLPFPLGTADEFVEQLFRSVTSRTKLIVISHVTSQTATIFPVQAVCERARNLGLPVCIDGPHALALTDVQLNQIGCDYYVASCHKWLCAPLGTGFLFARDPGQLGLRPAITSWGRSLSGRPAQWQDEFHWSGTFDPSGYLAIPTALDFIEHIGLDYFRDTTRRLCKYARKELEAATEGEAITPEDRAWSGPMVTVRLPRVARSPTWPGTMHPLQAFLWERYQIEAPVFEWLEQLCIRVSCHLYNRPTDIRRLAEAVCHFQDS